jgi:excisionase family DNA binding protein
MHKQGVRRAHRGMTNNTAQMTDSADQLAAAIRAVVNEAAHAALRAERSTQTPSPSRRPTVPPEGKQIAWPSERMLFPLKEVQQRLGIGRSTVYQLLGNGQLRSVKIGRRRFVSAAALEAYVDGLSCA